MKISNYDAIWQIYQEKEQTVLRAEGRTDHFVYGLDKGLPEMILNMGMEGYIRVF